MDIRIAVPEESITAPVLDAGLEAVTRLNERLLEAGRVPSFGEAVRKGGVKWKPEPPGDESFDHAAKVVGRKWGDCDDLAPYQAASLRVTGEDRGAHAVVYKSGPSRWHAVVKRSDGTLEDPSQTAGMRVNARTAGIPPSVVGMMFRPNVVAGESARPAIAVRRMGDALWQARTDIPWNYSDYAMAALNKGATPASAMIGSVLGACMIGDASAAADPEHVAKLYAVVGLMRGRHPRELCERLGDDVVGEAIEALHGMGFRKAGRPFVSCVGFDLFQPSSYHEIVDNPAKVVQEAGDKLKPITDVAKTVLSTAQGIVSLIPGIGTGISAAIGAGLAVLEGGGPIDIAVRTAYGAIPIPPGIRYFTDMVLDAALALFHKVTSGADLTKAALASAMAAARSAVVSKLPKGTARDLGGQVFDTLAHLIAQAIHTDQPTQAVVLRGPRVSNASVQAALRAKRPIPPHVVAIAPTSKAHVAVHLALSKVRVPSKPAAPVVPPGLAAAIAKLTNTRKYLVWGSSVMVPA